MVSSQLRHREKWLRWSWSRRLGDIMLNCQTDLHVFDRSSVTRDRYCKVVILTHVSPFPGAIEPHFAFMADNVLPHRTADVQ
ncbi:hypothetical protein TNCV_2506491 [Trichonephila clavipes]|uniref:Tc1-like transposase DDE domain-containing protein n=1 Tax=Trichonephila clavipes TaxID=2585209 RepID=A0A8X6WI68_TRICX|nr:hypothetical protein TNCV_2506491 [Trichonephila clavipes]